MTAVDALVDFLAGDERVKKFCNEPLSPEYSYASLSAMLLDAIFSIGVRYGQVKKLVAQHAASHKYDPWRLGAADPYPLPRLITEGRAGTAKQFAEKLKNHCLTSTRAGILKAEAVLLAAELLVRHGIVDLASWRASNAAGLSAVEKEFRAITGQGSGVSWDYLCCLQETRIE
jgi:hypothetical protein